MHFQFSKEREMNDTNDLLVAGLWFLVAEFSLGTTASFLIWSLVFAKPTDSRRPLSYQGDLRRTVAVLQQLQVLIGCATTESDPNLADLLYLIQAVQQEFGHTAPLEGVIQALVARDLEHQMAVRRQKRAGCPAEGGDGMRSAAESI
jgi:hypothetical protein